MHLADFAFALYSKQLTIQAFQVHICSLISSCFPWESNP